MERKLVSVQRIDSLAPIPGADMIEQARVMGWTVVVRKGEFAAGDPCVFFEIDSVLPDGPEWSEFMRVRKFRVKTLKLRGVLSQGLALPTSILPIRAALNPALDPFEGDLSELLGVTKYEPPIPESKEIAGPFPTIIPKTDEIRLQSCLGVLDELKGREFYVTTKLDGTSATFYQDPERGLRVCSRNWEIRQGNNLYWRMAEKYNLASVLPPFTAIQGEIVGPGIQKNRMELSEPHMFVFSVYDAMAGRFIDGGALVAFCLDSNLDTVPIEIVVQHGPAYDVNANDLDAWLNAARGFYAGTKNRKEGIVVRPLVETYSPTLNGRLSFKVINNDFLLKDEE